MRHIDKQATSLVVILASALGSGCISLPGVYGETWAAPVKLDGNACANIDGEYQNAGEQFSSGTYERSTVSLAYLLGSHAGHRDDSTLAYTFENPAEDAYQTVRLRRDRDTLNVVASRADGSRREFELPTREDCRDSMVQLGAAWQSGTVLVASLVGRNTISLGRAEDGSLLIRQADAGVGLLFYMPIVAGTSENWVLFAPAAAAPEPEREQEAQQLTAIAPQPME